MTDKRELRVERTMFNGKLVIILESDGEGNVGGLEKWMVGMLHKTVRATPDNLDGWNKGEGLGQIASAIQRILEAAEGE